MNFDVLSTTPKPGLTGAYYWLPIANGLSVSWQVLSCHDLGRNEEVGHIQLWPLVLDQLATAWPRNARTLKNTLRHRYTALPRGRVTQVQNRFMILHGSDAPVSDWIPMVTKKFELDPHPYKILFDEHEQTLADDRDRIKTILGLRFGQGATNTNP